MEAAQPLFWSVASAHLSKRNVCIDTPMDCAEEHYSLLKANSFLRSALSDLQVYLLEERSLNLDLMVENQQIKEENLRLKSNRQGKPDARRPPPRGSVFSERLTALRTEVEALRKDRDLAIQENQKEVLAMRRFSEELLDRLGKAQQQNEFLESSCRELEERFENELDLVHYEKRRLEETVAQTRSSRVKKTVRDGFARLQEQLDNRNELVVKLRGQYRLLERRNRQLEEVAKIYKAAVQEKTSKFEQEISSLRGKFAAQDLRRRSEFQNFGSLVRDLRKNVKNIQIVAAKAESAREEHILHLDRMVSACLERYDPKVLSTPKPNWKN